MPLNQERVVRVETGIVGGRLDLLNLRLWSVLASQALFLGVIEPLDKELAMVVLEQAVNHPGRELPEEDLVGMPQ